jgi:hypothetical protein
MARAYGQMILKGPADKGPYAIEEYAEVEEVLYSQPTKSRISYNRFAINQTLVHRQERDELVAHPILSPIAWLVCLGSGGAFWACVLMRIFG